MVAETPLEVARLESLPWLASVEYHETIGSTNDRARELSDAASLPALVIAEQQTAGRGRGSKRWWTGSGSLALSLVFEPEAIGLPGHLLPRTSLAAGVAVVTAVEPLIRPFRVGLHWPNDVYADGRKLAGVLVELPVPRRIVIGIGLNVNNRADAAPSEVAQRSVSLADLSGSPLDRTSVLVSILETLWQHLAELAADPELYGRCFQAHCLQIGRSLSVDVGRQRVTGVCEGVATDGALLLATSTGRRHLHGGVVVKAEGIGLGDMAT